MWIPTSEIFRNGKYAKWYEHNAEIIWQIFPHSTIHIHQQNWCQHSFVLHAKYKCTWNIERTWIASIFYILWMDFTLISMLAKDPLIIPCLTLYIYAVFTSMLTIDDSNDIERNQKITLKIILCPFYESYESACNQQNWHPGNQRTHSHLCPQISWFSITQKLLPLHRNNGYFSQATIIMDHALMTSPYFRPFLTSLSPPFSACQ